VTAEEAKARRRSGAWRYVCPGCDAPVDLRGGRIYAAYFAHRVGTASEDCAYYHPGGEYTYAPVGPSFADPDAVRPLSLYLTVQGGSDPRPQWGLALLVPRSPTQTGTVVVREGVSGMVRVPCSTLNRCGLPVPVRARTDTYELEVSADVDPDYARRVTVPTPGLDLFNGNVFRDGSQGGRRLADTTPLYWGRSYYVIWRRDLAVRWPTSIRRDYLQDSGVMRCAWVELPLTEDEATLDWADEFLGRSIERPSVTLGVVTPIISATQPDDSLLVDADAEVIIAVVREPGSTMPDALSVTRAGMTTPSRVFLPAGGDIALVSLGSIPRGLTRVAVELEEDEDAVLTLDVHTRIVGHEPPSVMLMLREADGQEQRIPVYSAEAERALGRVRDGAATLVSVSLPPRVGCVIRGRTPEHDVWRDDAIQWSRSEHLTDSDAHEHERMSEVTRRLAKLLSAGVEFEAIFGNFGRVHLRAVAKRAASRARAIPNVVRSRIHWLLSVAGSATSEPAERAPCVPTPRILDDVLRTACAQVNPTDQALLQLIAGRRRWPPAVEPHLRVLATELRSAWGAGEP
jgi:hypothetical protein